MSYRQVTRAQILYYLWWPPYLLTTFYGPLFARGPQCSCFISPSWNLASHLSIFGDSSSFVLLDCARSIFHTQIYVLYLEPHLSCRVRTFCPTHSLPLSGVSLFLSYTRKPAPVSEDLGKKNADASPGAEDACGAAFSSLDTYVTIK